MGGGGSHVSLVKPVKPLVIVCKTKLRMYISTSYQLEVIRLHARVLGTS